MAGGENTQIERTAAGRVFCGEPIEGWEKGECGMTEGELKWF